MAFSSTAFCFLISCCRPAGHGEPNRIESIALLLEESIAKYAGADGFVSDCLRPLCLLLAPTSSACVSRSLLDVVES